MLAQLYKLSLRNKYIFNPSLWIIDNFSPSVVNIYLGLWPREIYLLSVQCLSIFYMEGLNIYNLLHERVKWTNQIGNIFRYSTPGTTRHACRVRRYGYQ